MILQSPSRMLVRRATFLAAHISIVLVVYWILGIPVQVFFAERNARIDDEVALLIRLESVAAQEDTVREIIRSTSAELNRNEFLAGVNDGVIGADLQTRLKAIVETSGAKLNLVQTLPPSNRGSIRYVGARIELLGTHATVQRTIHAVESSKPYLFVTAAVVRISPTHMQPNAVSEPLVDAQLEIFGALQADRGTQ